MVRIIKKMRRGQLKKTCESTFFCVVDCNIYMQTTFRIYLSKHLRKSAIIDKIQHYRI